MKPLRILALLDFGTTGISESLRLPLVHWHEQGHEIWQLALGYNGWGARLERTMYPWADRMLPIFGVSPEERFGQRVIANALDMAKPDIIISALDVWMVSYLAQPEITPYLDERTREMLSHAKRNFKHIAYFPVDGAVSGQFLPVGMDEVIAGFDFPLTYSRYAHNVIKRSMSIDVPFIPIAHDPEMYKPRDRDEARKQLGLNLPDKSFVIGMVATNQYRKLWGEFFEAVIPLAKKYPDIKVLPWTTWGAKILGGSEIAELVYQSGIQSQIINPTEMVGGMSDEGMAQLYATMNVLVLTTVGEGAGLPPLRARACGIPALVSDNTSNTEFCGHEFDRVPVRGTFHDPFGSNIERYLTDVDELRNRLETLYLDSVKYREVAIAGIEEMRQYEKDKVIPKWDAVLEEVL